MKTPLIIRWSTTLQSAPAQTCGEKGIIQRITITITIASASAIAIAIAITITNDLICQVCWCCDLCSAHRPLSILGRLKH